MKSVFIVDDHPIVRRGLHELFEREPDFDVCGEAAGVAEAFEATLHLTPDLVVTDLTLVGRNGLDLVKQLHTHRPDLPVLVLSMHDEHLYAERVLNAGARGYVMKQRSDCEVIRAAREVLAGHTYVSEPVRRKMLAHASVECGNGEASVDLLSDREFEVFLLIGQGYAPRHIAEKLSLSPSTVEVYRERLKEKLRLESSPMLIRYAVQWTKDQQVP